MSHGQGVPIRCSVLKKSSLLLLPRVSNDFEHHIQGQFLIRNTIPYSVLLDGMKIVHAHVSIRQMSQFTISMNVFINATFLEGEHLPRSRKFSSQSWKYFYDPRMSTGDTRIVHSVKIAKKILFWNPRAHDCIMPGEATTFGNNR